MANEPYAQVKGKVIRITRTDACGVPLAGTGTVTVSKRISSVTLEEQSESGTDVRDRNFGDELTVVDDSYEETIGYTADIALNGVDPFVITALTGARLIKDAAGDVIGFGKGRTVDIDNTHFALEIWTKLAGNICDATTGHRKWGYTPFPHLWGGRLGGFTFENGTVNFTISGAKTAQSNRWGAGPFEVTRDEAGLPSVLHEPLLPDEMFQNITVTLDPPDPVYGSFPLASV